MKTTKDVTAIETLDSSRKSLYKVGFWSALVAFVGAFGYSVAQILQLVSLVRYPLDAILIYGFSLCIATPFILAMLALHYLTPSEKRFWSHAALLFALMYALYVNLNYVVQLATVIPKSLQGALDEIRVLDQTPHSLFWDVDALGYIFMGLATLFAVPVFAKTGLQKWLRWFFLANGLITPVIAFVYFYPSFSTALLLLGSPWLVTAPGSILLLTIMFKRSQP
ncbi:MAG: hypothetical protein ONB44_11355 [candidate division KSB1 bacterium]|nr:hypothetical protein [candidate division KSB1 bacterium]MDZ7302720.1 hypothetical protein [candidate division KSB1 bacterium]MDZ7311749.1 hypothetical protein [candidate division KSB1 bacterium]